MPHWPKIVWCLPPGRGYCTLLLCVMCVHGKPWTLAAFWMAVAFCLVTLHACRILILIHAPCQRHILLLALWRMFRAEKNELHEWWNVAICLTAVLALQQQEGEETEKKYWKISHWTSETIINIYVYVWHGACSWVYTIYILPTAICSGRTCLPKSCVVSWKVCLLSPASRVAIHYMAEVCWHRDTNNTSIRLHT